MKRLLFLLVLLIYSAYAQTVSHNATQIKAGQFGLLFGGGNYSFPDSLSIGSSIYDARLRVNGSVIVTAQNNNVIFTVNDISEKVGIGTTTPDSTLHVIGGLCVESSDSGCSTSSGYIKASNGFCIGSNCITSWSSGGGSSGGWVMSGNYLYNDTSNVKVGIGAASPSAKLEIIGTGATLNVSNSTHSHLFVNGTTGNVGIGTTAPSAKLDVVGNIEIDSWDSQLLQGYSGGGYMRRSIGGAHGWDSTRLYINGWNDWTGGVSVGGSGGSSNFYVTGNVGIGTTSPVHNFQVYRTSLVNPSLTYSTGATAGIRTENIDIAFGAYTADPWAAWIQARHTTNQSWPLVINPLGGNVGIGTTNPGSYKLYVEGSLYSSGSSIEYKENIADLEINSSKIYLLQPKSFDYKPEYKHMGKILAGGRQFGLIAEDVVKIFPELVISNGNKTTANVDYEKLSVIILAEMKNQKKKIDQLELENQELRLQLKNLTQRVEELEHTQMKIAVN
jgi:hypothetical protein